MSPLDLLQSVGLSKETAAQLFAWWALILLVARSARRWLVPLLTAATDRLDTMADRGRTDGAVLLRIVDSRIYGAVWFIADLVFRIHLPTRATLEARWDRIEQAKRDAVHAETLRNPNLDGTGLFSVLGLLTLIPFLLTACAHLAPNGPYRGDQILYTAERTTVGAYDTLDAFVTWELKHRATLARWPEIRASADQVRRNARQWIDSAIAFTEAYRGDPSEANRHSLETSLRVLRAALDEAGRHMLTATTTP